MSSGEVAAAFRATFTCPDKQERERAEQFIRKLESSPSVLQTYLTTIVEQQKKSDAQVLQSIVLRVKNIIKDRWSVTGKSGSISDSDRSFVKAQLLKAIAATELETIQVQLVDAVYSVAQIDFPTSWSNVVPDCVTMLKSSNPVHLAGGVRAVRMLYKRIQYKKEEPFTSARRELNKLILPLIFPAMGRSMEYLCKQQDPFDRGHQAAGIVLWYTSKVFFLSNQFGVAPFYKEEKNQDFPVFSRWVEAAIAVCRQVFRTPAGIDAYKLNAHPIFKAKKWLTRTLNRFFVVYGNPASVSEENVRFSKWFSQKYRLPILDVMLYIVFTHTPQPLSLDDDRAQEGKEYVARTTAYSQSPAVRHKCYLMIAGSMRYADMWQYIAKYRNPDADKQPNALKLGGVSGLIETILHCMKLAESDLDTWISNPHEYVRAELDVMAEFKDVRVAASVTLLDMCVWRTSLALPQCRGYVLNTLKDCNTYLSRVGYLGSNNSTRIPGQYWTDNAGKEGPAKNNAPGYTRDWQWAVRKEAACRFLYVLKHIIAYPCKDSNGKLEDIDVLVKTTEKMLCEYVFAEARSPVGFMRARALDMIGRWIKFPFTKQGVVPMCAKCVFDAMSTRDVAVRIQAGMALSRLVRNPDVMKMLAPYLKQALESVMFLIGTLDNDTCVGILSEIAQNFGDRMGPYAVDVINSMSDLFFRKIGDGKEMATEEALEVAESCVMAISATTRAVKDPAMYNKVEGVLDKMAARVYTQDGRMFLQEFLQIVGNLAKYGKNVQNSQAGCSAFAWKCFALSIRAYHGYARDYVDDICPILTIFIAEHPSAVCKVQLDVPEQERKSGAPSSINALIAIMSIVDSFFNPENVEDTIRYEVPAAKHALKLVESLMINCRRGQWLPLQVYGNTVKMTMTALSKVNEGVQDIENQLKKAIGVLQRGIEAAKRDQKVASITSDDEMNVKHLRGWVMSTRGLRMALLDAIALCIWYNPVAFVRTVGLESAQKFFNMWGDVVMNGPELYHKRLSHAKCALVGLSSLAQGIFLCTSNQTNLNSQTKSSLFDSCFQAMRVCYSLIKYVLSHRATEEQGNERADKKSLEEQRQGGKSSTRSASKQSMQENLSISSYGEAGDEYEDYDDDDDDVELWMADKHPVDLPAHVNSWEHKAEDGWGSDDELDDEKFAEFMHGADGEDEGEWETVTRGQEWKLGDGAGDTEERKNLAAVFIQEAGETEEYTWGFGKARRGPTAVDFANRFSNLDPFVWMAFVLSELPGMSERLQKASGQIALFGVTKKQRSQTAVSWQNVSYVMKRRMSVVKSHFQALYSNPFKNGNK